MAAQLQATHDPGWYENLTFHLHLCARRLGLLDKADRYLALQRPRRPEDEAFLAGQRCVLRVEQGRLEAAEAETPLFAERVIDPTLDADRDFALGRLREAQGRTDEARALYRRGLAVCPRDEISLRLDAL